MYQLDRSNKNGGGIAIYIRSIPKHRIVHSMIHTTNGVLDYLSMGIMSSSDNIIIASCPYCTI